MGPVLRESCHTRKLVILQCQFRRQPHAAFVLWMCPRHRGDLVGVSHHIKNVLQEALRYSLRQLPWAPTLTRRLRIGRRNAGDSPHVTPLRHYFGNLAERPPSSPMHSMPPKIHKVHRLLDLIALLTSRHYPLSRAQIWDEVEGYRAPLREGTNEASVRRTFERDKQELLELGFPLRTFDDPHADPAEMQRYHLSHRDFYLPYLRLVRQGEALEGNERKWVTPPGRIDPEQAWIAASALDALRRNPDLPRSAAADSAFRKLTFDLAQPEAEFPQVEVILSSDDDEARKRVEMLVQAVRERYPVRFEYHSIGRDEVAVRHAEPCALLFKFNRWYLIAHDRDREASRTFRVSRMVGLEVLDDVETFVLPELDLSEWRTADAWSLPGDDGAPVTVDVRFAFPRSLWADRNQRGTLVATAEDASAVRRFAVRSVDPFLRWLLSFGTDVKIESPSELADALLELRRRVAAIYGAVIEEGVTPPRTGGARGEDAPQEGGA